MAGKKWKETNSGELYIWGSVFAPTEIEGILRGYAPGKYGTEEMPTLVKLEVDGAIQKWTMPAILKSRLDLIPLGSLVRIEHAGSVTLKSGNLAHNFRVYVNAPEESGE